MRRRAAPAKPGFTVLEALIALVIIGLAVVTTVEALGGGLRAGGQVSRHLEAVALAETKMNELGALPHDSLGHYGGGRGGVFAAPFERYTWRAAVAPLAGNRSLLRATITVGWEGRAYTLETVFYGRNTSGEPAAATRAGDVMP